MKEFDFNSVRTKLIFAFIALLIIFCFARMIKPIVYDEEDITQIFNIDGENFIVSAERTHSTEEWERNIRTNKRHPDAIESTKKEIEESISQ